MTNVRKRKVVDASPRAPMLIFFILEQRETYLIIAHARAAAALGPHLPLRLHPPDVHVIKIVNPPPASVVVAPTAELTAQHEAVAARLLPSHGVRFTTAAAGSRTGRSGAPALERVR